MWGLKEIIYVKRIENTQQMKLILITRENVF